MLSRLVGRRASAIWRARLPTRWMNHSLGRRVVMPPPAQYILLDTHNTATVTSRASNSQSTAAAKVSTASLPNTTPKQQEILMLNKDLIFTNVRVIDVDYKLVLIYVCLKTGYIKRALKLYKSLTESYPDQKERLADVNIYNALTEAYMKGDERSKRRALYRLDEMRRQKIKPNLTTYAILIRGFLRLGLVNRAQSLLMEMLKEGYSITAFMLNRNISNNDLKMLNLICKAKGRDHFEISSAQIKELLSSRRKPDTESTEALIEAKSTDVLDVRLLEASLIPAEANNTKLYERQLHFEEQAVSASIERLRAMAEARETSSNSYSLQSLMWSWHQKLYPIIVEEQKRACNPVGHTSKLTGSLFLTLLNAEKLSMLTIQQLLRLSMDRDMGNDISVTRAVNAIGKAIEMEYYTEQLRQHKNDLIQIRRLNLQALYSSGQLFDMHMREIQAKLLEEEKWDGDWLERWPKHVRIKVGALLISLLLRVAKIRTTYYDKETDKHV
jgi:DNA-directed RNA polymerase